MTRILLGLVALIWAQAALAQQMTAVAVSPDGGTLLAAGDNRVLYTLDPATLEVTQRRYITEMVREILFSSDGGRVFLRMDNEDFRAHSSGSFKLLYEAEDVSAMSLAADSNRIALLEDNYDGGVLHIRAATSGKQIATYEFPDIETEQVALMPDGKTAMLFTDSEQSDTEEKQSPPSELKGHDKYVYRQQHDGYISQVMKVAISDGAYTIAPTYYRIGFPFQVRMVGDRMAFTNSATDSAMVAADGATELMNLGEKYVSAARISNDGSAIVMTSSGEVRVHPLNGATAGETARLLEVPRIDGPSERVTAMTEAGDGTLYLVTSAYRILKIAPGAGAPEVKPVF